MESEQGGKPLLEEWRSSVSIEDFCLNTGLDRETVEKLVRERFLEDSLWAWEEPSRPKSIFIDALPSRDTLVSMGLAVRDDYDPEALRFGGLECPVHGWARSVLLTRYDAVLQLEVPDGSMCWECSRAGVPREGTNSTTMDPETLERWVQQTLGRRHGTLADDD